MLAPGSAASARPRTGASGARAGTPRIARASGLDRFRAVMVVRISESEYYGKSIRIEAKSARTVRPVESGRGLSYGRGRGLRDSTDARRRLAHHGAGRLAAPLPRRRRPGSGSRSCGTTPTRTRRPGDAVERARPRCTAIRRTAPTTRPRSRCARTSSRPARS